ncbi:MAG: FAD-binding oxidoreductase [bacterium]|nr:FAD-binding oxidoreductase [bacterium]
MKNNHPTIVVGAGLAGLSVAVRLIEKNQPVVLYDNGVNHSSRVAAGMINPLVFRRMNRAWRIDECIEAVHSFYSDMEKKTEQSFFHPVVIRRMFSNEHERELWMQKQPLPEYDAYMTKTTEADDNFKGAINNFGSGRVKNASYVSTSVFLEAVKEYIVEKADVRNEPFDYNEIEEGTYKGEPFERIVFCEGYRGLDNPFFNYLPLQQTKGETLVIKSDSIPENESVNRKCFILPMGNQQFKVGSTYDWDSSDTSITEAGRAAILEKVAYLTEDTVEVIDQEAGVRPTTPDRRGMMGQHPEHKKLYIFNGLGTKGYLIAPLLSREFVEHLINDAPLNQEVDIERFRIKHFPSNQQ